MVGTSAVNDRASVSGIARKRTAISTMNAKPHASAASASRRAAAKSPRPIALPTIAAPAPATPSGTMNVTDAICSAIWCPASGMVPIQPIASPTKPNAKPSANI
jgi:hypothetical protein